MNDFKGTKGEWSLGKLTAKEGMFSTISCGNDLVIAFRHGNQIKDEVGLANEKLIAAAPLLLEALQDMIYLFDRHLPEQSIGRKRCDEAINAINKATS